MPKEQVHFESSVRCHTTSKSPGGCLVNWPLSAVELEQFVLSRKDTLDSHACRVLPASPRTLIDASLIATNSLWLQQEHRGDERRSARGIRFYHVDAEGASLAEGEAAH